MSQHVSAVGLVATEPKLFIPEGGVQFCTFRLACTERRFDGQKKEWIDGETNWFTVNTFRTLAVHAKESFSKGDRVVVSGRLRVRSWEKHEKKGTSIEIDADGLGHDVRWGVSTFAKRTGLTSPAQDAVQPEASPESVTAAVESFGVAEPSIGPPSTGLSSTAAPADSASPANEEFLADNFTPNAGAA